MSESMNLEKPSLPEGTVTFLFTDIEGSTRLLSQLGKNYVKLMAEHHRLLREVFGRHDGREVDTEGDAFFVSFPRAADALAAVVEAQRAITQHDWPGDAEVRVRMGLHTGEPWTGGEGYVGMDVHRAARIAHTGHGGQVLLSATTTQLILDQLPEGVSLLDLGFHRLKDMKRPEHIHQLVIESLPADFPSLKSLGVVTPPQPPEFEPPEPPPFLEDASGEPERPVFVSRERELSWLEERLDEADTGQGQVIFLTGEAGTGKSSLLGAFARQATDQYPELLVTWGQCNAFSGQGDPYLPFREIFAQLCGGVEGPWRSGLLASKAARRLWMTLPETARAINMKGKDLFEHFLSGQELLSHLKAAAPDQHALHNQLQALLDRDPYASGSGSQSRLLEQATAILETLSSKHPLLIILDDMQWVDRGSVDLLFQLGRQITNQRILVVAAYRPEEVAAGRRGERHPLEAMVEEFKRIYGDQSLDLAQVEGRAFIDAFIDSEPNQLNQAFRDRLFRRTGGHALFTVELLRDMQERRDLVRNEERRWTESEQLDWDLLPARVEGVIESRIGRLEESLREILTVASVEGETFTAQVVARVQELQERKLLRSLSRELALRHHLVSERQAVEVGKQLLARFRFAHALFQRYLYNEIGQAERRLLHREIAAILEEIYGEDKESIAVQLALHFDEAGENDKAMTYFLHAGDQARQMSAYQEGIDHYRSALNLADRDQHLDNTARILMKLGLTYNLNMDYEIASKIYQQAFSVWQQASRITAERPLPLSDQPLRLRFTDPGTLDPLWADASHRSEHVNALFSGLAQLTLDGDIMPDVAERWDVLDDGKRYVFHLRSDVFWRDGSQVTAYDFEYAWRRRLNLDRVGYAFLGRIRGAQAYLSDPKTKWEEVGIKAEDDNTLVVELEEPFAHFLHLVALTVLFPVPHHVVEEKGEDWAKDESLVSNGPFFLESWRQRRRTFMTYVRNPNYHGRATGNVDRVVADRTGGLQFDDVIRIYESNQTDRFVFGYEPRVKLDILIKRFADDYMTAPELSTRYIVLNPEKPPLDKVNVRKALAMAVNREAIRNELGHFHEMAYGGLIPPGMVGHSPDVAIRFDSDQAREILKSEGFVKDNQLWQLKARHHDNFKEEFLIPVDNWREYLGLQITVNVSGWNEFLNGLRDDLPQIYRIAWAADYPDPSTFLRTALSRIRAVWNHRPFERLLNDAERELNQAKRIEIYQQADRMLIEEAIVIPVVYERQHWLVKPWVKNLFPSTYGRNRLENVILEPH